MYRNELNINFKFFKENMYCTGSTNCGEESYKFYGPLQLGPYSLQVWSIENTDKPTTAGLVLSFPDEAPVGSAPSESHLLHSDYEIGNKVNPSIDTYNPIYDRTNVHESTIVHERDRRYVEIKKPDKTNNESGGVTTHYIPIKKKEIFDNERFIIPLINNKPERKNRQGSIQALFKNPIHQDKSYKDRDDQNDIDEEHHERLLGVHSEGPQKLSKKGTKNMVLEIRNVHRVKLIPSDQDNSFPLFPKSKSRDSRSDIDYNAKWQFNLYKNGVFVEPKSDSNLTDFEWTHYKHAWQDQIWTTRQITNIIGNLHKKLNTDTAQAR